MIISLTVDKSLQYDKVKVILSNILWLIFEANINYTVEYIVNIDKVVASLVRFQMFKHRLDVSGILLKP
jgi:hypothetical protein